MKKEANLISILNAYKDLETELFKQYLAYHSIPIGNHKLDKFDEFDDLSVLVEEMLPFVEQIDVFDKFFIGFKIPQIDKEFDLLRIGTKTIINIELKSRSSEEKIEKQLRRNQYYLSFLEKEMFYYTYVSSTKILYKLDGDNGLQETNLEDLVYQLAQQEVKPILDIDSYFNPSNYLVSPFNSTEKFINGEYFLTGRQEEIKGKVIQKLDSPHYEFFAIKGRAGSGKTLLTYDISKEVALTKKVLIVHCGKLNIGHHQLLSEYNWDITEAKYIMQKDLSTYDLIVIDEAQRIRKRQLNQIVKEIQAQSKKCIFSYDENQTLQKQEIQWNNKEEFETYAKDSTYELKTKIRTNKEVSSFIDGLFNKYKQRKNNISSSIFINYFSNNDSARSFLEQLDQNSWTVVNYTPSIYHILPYEQYQIFGNPTAHDVIGQEFDNVVGVLDEYFYYKQDGSLSTQNYPKYPHYHPTKMLFQIMSRTRLRLNIVIINNPEVLERCLEITSSTDKTKAIEFQKIIGRLDNLPIFVNSYMKGTK